MKIVVLSDTHGAFRLVEEVLEKNPSARLVLFLGDGAQELEEMALLYPEKQFLMVCGNCDFSSSLPEHRVVEAGGHRIYMTHGHYYGVKSGDLSRLAAAAKAQGCDIALYGHTHEARTDTVDGVLCINPGSVRYARQDGPAYCELNLTGSAVIPVEVPLGK